MIDYSIYYRRAIKVDKIKQEVQKCDVLISAYNPSDRIKKVFDDIQATTKIWLIQPEYLLSPIDYPTEHELVTPNSNDEMIQVNELLQKVGDLKGKSLCIDITGFMRHTLTFLVAKLAASGVDEFTAIYSEPMFYKKQENTTFTNTTSGVVRPIRGMAGINDSQGKDFLVLGVGYDSRLINEVVNHKDNSIVYPLFAFPSLSPDMYQQSAICSEKSGDVALSSDWIVNRRFAPANDPFSTAKAVRSAVEEIDKRESAANIYLSPLSTKVQTLGFALYWHLEGKKRGAVSILFPECTAYAQETSLGLKRLWAFTIELT